MCRKLFNFALLMGTVLLTGCLKSESNNNSGSQEYVITEGAYILNAGDPANGKDGSLTFLDYQADNTANVISNIYPVGNNPTDVLVWGNKVYIAGCGTNTIYVLDKKTRSLIDKINTVEEMGEEAGFGPSHLASYGSNVYVSTHGGYVAVIDTTSLTVNASPIKVGSYPEGMGIGVTKDSNGNISDITLWVANSDNGNGNGSLSKVNLKTGSVTEVKNDLISNPRSVLVAGSNAYVLDYGTIDTDGNQKNNGVYYVSGSNVSLLIEGATGISAASTSIITYNYPKGSDKVEYKVYNLYYDTLSNFYLNGGSAYPSITNPTAIALDPNAGYMLISNPNFINMYDGNGNFVKSFDTGDNPCSICYSYGTQVIKQ